MTDAETTRRAAHAVALRLLARRDHSIAELRRKLRERRYPPAVIDEVIDTCASRGYLDDQRFVDRQVEVLVEQQWGPLRIKQKLAARGLASALVEQALATVSRQRFIDHARDRLQRRFATDAPVSDEGDPGDRDARQRERERRYRHLLGRGFPAELVRELLFDD